MDNFAGGDGSSLENAVIITYKNQVIAVSKEYDYIRNICGERDKDYFFKKQTFQRVGDRYFDTIDIALKDKTKREFWFDITASYKNF